MKTFKVKLRVEHEHHIEAENEMEAEEIAIENFVQGYNITHDNVEVAEPIVEV